MDEEIYSRLHLGKKYRNPRNKALSRPNISNFSVNIIEELIRLSFIVLMYLCSKFIEWLFTIYLLIFTAAGVVACGGRETSPRTSSLCRLYLLVLWDHCFHFNPLKIEFRLRLC